MNRQGPDLTMIRQQKPWQMMPDTMDLNVTTPNVNPSALVRYATLPLGEPPAGNRLRFAVCGERKLWKITMS